MSNQDFFQIRVWQLKQAKMKVRIKTTIFYAAVEIINKQSK
jgi:hypothetical protein